MKTKLMNFILVVFLFGCGKEKVEPSVYEAFFDWGHTSLYGEMQVFKYTDIRNGKTVRYVYDIFNMAPDQLKITVYDSLTGNDEFTGTQVEAVYTDGFQRWRSGGFYESITGSVQLFNLKDNRLKASFSFKLINTQNDQDTLTIERGVLEATKVGNLIREF
ncbi:MAG: hypothetical protein OEW75_09460 [Cyclobacteriaceae bacterium]|nr:hypothetical protein [Cyclobacteriaceae bacterium]